MADNPRKDLDPESLYGKPSALSVADRKRIEDEVPKKMSRSEAKQKKELEEARKVCFND